MTESCFAMDEIPKTFSSEALKKLNDWEWPGNVRELRMCIERSVAYSQSATISPDEIIFHVPNDISELPESLADLERQHIIKILEDKSGNISATAKQIGISRTTPYHPVP
jgi:DNA-binding NtrC family response regulator